MTDFETVFQENQAAIFKYLMKLCGNRALAEELTQETFFRAYMNFSRLRDKNKASAWLFQIAKRLYYAWCGENRRTAELDESMISDAPDIANSFVEKERSAAAFSALHELEEPYREVFMLAVFANLSLKDVSALFGKSESWARVTFYRARKKLMERLR